MTQTMPQSVKDLVVESEMKTYSTRVHRVAQGLRELADEIERLGVRAQVRVTNNYDDLPCFGDSASRVIHTLHWGIANLHLDGIVQAATNVDLALRAPTEED